MTFERFKELWLRRLPMPTGADDATPRANAELAKLADGEPNVFEDGSLLQPPVCELGTEAKLVALMTKWRTHGPRSVMQVFLAPLGVSPEVKPDGWQCELAFGDETTRSFQAATLEDAISEAHVWAYFTFRFKETSR